MRSSQTIAPRAIAVVVISIALQILSCQDPVIIKMIDFIDTLRPSFEGMFQGIFEGVYNRNINF